MTSSPPFQSNSGIEQILNKCLWGEIKEEKSKQEKIEDRKFSQKLSESKISGIILKCFLIIENSRDWLEASTLGPLTLLKSQPR